MSKTLSIPIRQTITLPDNWQACRTPQELSYWLIAQFEEFESDVSDLETAVGSLEHDVGVLQGTVGDNSSGLVKAVNDLTTDVGNIDGRLVTVEGQINTPSTGLNARVGALETTVGDANSGLVKDVAQLLNDFSGLSYDVASLNSTVNTAGTGLVDRVGALETAVSAPVTGLTAKVTDLEAEAEYSYNVELDADANLPTPASNFKKARFYITSDDLGAWTATITSALATALKSTIGYQAEFIVASAGSEDVKLDVTAIYDVMKLDSIDGIDHTIFGTGTNKYLTVDDPSAKKLTIWWNGTSFDWSVANVAIKALDTRVTALEQGGGGGKYIHGIMISIPYYSAAATTTANRKAQVVYIQFISDSSTPITTMTNLISSIPDYCKYELHTHLFGYDVAGALRLVNISWKIMNSSAIEMHEACWNMASSMGTPSDYFVLTKWNESPSNFSITSDTVYQI